jgi:hypothetical protein
MGWQAARLDCRVRGGVLASIEWVNVNSWVYEQVAGFGGAEPLWIGANDITTEGSFWWASYDREENSILTYEPFVTGEPDGGEDENCVVFGVRGLSVWGDDDCEREHGYICRVADL